jgi:predicted kinase
VPGRLLVISGLPAAGKTTLAKMMGAELGLVHVWRDGLRRSMSQWVDTLSREQNWLLGEAFNELVNTVLGAVLDAGHGAVVDSNFNRDEQAEAVRRFVATRRPRCFEICLWGDSDVLRRRFIERADPPLTEDLQPYFDRVLARERRPVLGPPVPTVQFETSDFAALEGARAGLIAQVRAALDL